MYTYEHVCVCVLSRPYLGRHPEGGADLHGHVLVREGLEPAEKEETSDVSHKHRETITFTHISYRAKPKSQILTVKASSSRMLADFRSLFVCLFVCDCVCASSVRHSDIFD